MKTNFGKKIRDKLKGHGKEFSIEEIINEKDNVILDIKFENNEYVYEEITKEGSLTDNKFVYFYKVKSIKGNKIYFILEFESKEHFATIMFTEDSIKMNYSPDKWILNPFVTVVDEDSVYDDKEVFKKELYKMYIEVKEKIEDSKELRIKWLLNKEPIEKGHKNIKMKIK